MSNAEPVPPNILAMLKHPAAASILLGLKIESYDVAAGCVQVTFDAEPQLLNKLGIIQGGMLAAMLDEAMTLAVGLSLAWGEISPTLELQVNFIRAAQLGRIRGMGRVLRRGKSVAFLEGELTTEGGALIATASATVSIGHMKKFAGASQVTG
jgi:uncharacterized protein (TIGR00369 family)